MKAKLKEKALVSLGAQKEPGSSKLYWETQLRYLGVLTKTPKPYATEKK